MLTYQHLYKILFSLISVCSLVCTSSCQGHQNHAGGAIDESTASQHRIQDEQLANKYLSRARDELKRGDLDKATRSIEEMRDSCRLAFSARKAGILLLDSIELQRAQSDTTQSDWPTRVKFYQKKLQHDLKTP